MIWCMTHPAKYRVLGPFARLEKEAASGLNTTDLPSLRAGAVGVAARAGTGFGDGRSDLSERQREGEEWKSCQVDTFLVSLVPFLPHRLTTSAGCALGLGAQSLSWLLL